MVAERAFLDVIERHLGRVWHLCSRMTLRGNEAEAACLETCQRAWVGRSGAPERDDERGLWLLRIAAHVLGARLPQAPEVDFDLLDETLRSEATRTEEVASLTDPQRELLLWEMKQGCMTAVVNCLSPGERVAFVMSAVMGLSDDEAARALDIKGSALKVRLSRARKKVSDYLAPRCEHIDPRNPCHCPSRIGIALRKGFIAPPARAEVRLRGALPPFDEAPRLNDAVAIYRTLPEPEPPGSLRRRIDAAVSSGAWGRA